MLKVQGVVAESATTQLLHTANFIVEPAGVDSWHVVLADGGLSLEAASATAGHLRAGTPNPQRLREALLHARMLVRDDLQRRRRRATESPWEWINPLSMFAVLATRQSVSFAWIGAVQALLVRAAIVRSVAARHVEVVPSGTSDGTQHHRELLTRSLENPDALVDTSTTSDMQCGDRIILCSGAVATVLSEACASATPLGNLATASAIDLAALAVKSGTSTNPTAIVTIDWAD